MTLASIRRVALARSQAGDFEQIRNPTSSGFPTIVQAPSAGVVVAATTGANDDAVGGILLVYRDSP